MLSIHCCCPSSMEIQKDIETLEKHGVYTLQYNVMQLPVKGVGGEMVEGVVFADYLSTELCPQMYTYLLRKYLGMRLNIFIPPLKPIKTIKTGAKS